MQRPFVFCSLALSPALLSLAAGCDSQGRSKTYHRGDATKQMQKINARLKGEFTPLTLADFDVFYAKKPKPDDPPTWTEKDGVVSCIGTPFGYLYSKKTYRNFELVFEYRFAKPKERSDYAKLNTGCLIFIQGKHRRWPACLEVQGKWLEMGMIKSNARDVKPQVSDEPKARTEGRNEPGHWNEISVRTMNGQVMSQLNGRTVAGSEPTRLKEGPIGFQAEGSKVEFRNIRISVLPDEPPKKSTGKP